MERNDGSVHIMSLGRVISLLVLTAEVLVTSTNGSLSLQTKLREEATGIATSWARFLGEQDVNCDDLIYIIEDSDENYEFCGNHLSNVTLQLRWQPDSYSKEVRCFCTLAVFQLMIPFKIEAGNVTFCGSGSTFTCAKEGDCDYNVTEYESQCIVRTSAMYPLKGTNMSIVSVFSGLSCVLIEDYREDVCDILFQSNDSEDMTIGVVIGSTMLATIIILLVLIVFIVAISCYYRRKFNASKNQALTKQPPSISVNGEHYLVKADNQLYSFIDDAVPHGGFDGLITVLKQKFESNTKLFQPSDLQIVDKLGEGAFGVVYKGVMSHSGIEVAIKTLKDNSTSEEIQEFVSEANIMLYFNHPNVMSLLGMSFDANNGFPQIVLPYMVNGDLKSFLLSSRKENNTDVLPECLDLLKLKLMCQDIATGMEYLAEVKYVHRDLAARNCMIDENLRVKVADFGFTRDVYGLDYYRLNRKTKLPVKWMPLESLLDNMFNEKTDVWSFGVTCWEVYSLGRAPYPGLDNSDILDYIQKGNKLRKPSLCSQQMFSIIWSCWADSPEQRPTFKELTLAMEGVSNESLKCDSDPKEHQYFQLETNQDHDTMATQTSN